MLAFFRYLLTAKDGERFAFTSWRDFLSVPKGEVPCVPANVWFLGFNEAYWFSIILIGLCPVERQFFNEYCGAYPPAFDLLYFFEESIIEV